MAEEKSSFVSYKKSPFLSMKHSTYFDVYDRLFSRYMGKEFVFVEVGVFNGGSLFMWRDYFGDKARIIGVDLNPLAKRWEEHGFEIFIGNQSDPNFWRSFIKAVGKIDVFLDDGGHTYEQQIVTVESVLPAINDDGLMVVEDTHTSYMSGFGPINRSFISYAKNIIDGINYRFGEFSEKKSEKTIYGISFYESFVIFDVCRKKASKRSVATKNNGQNLGAKDFRHEGRSLGRAKSYLRTLGLNYTLGRYFKY